MPLDVETNVNLLLCASCLCVGRNVRNISDPKLFKFYVDAINETSLCKSESITPIICWECEATLKRAVSFKEQIKDSFRILQTYTAEDLKDCLYTEISRPPHLQIYTQCSYNCTSSNDDNQKLIEIRLFVKDEIKGEDTHTEIKEEIQSDIDEITYNSDSSDVKCAESEVDNILCNLKDNNEETETVKKNKTEKKIKSKKKRRDGKKSKKVKKTSIGQKVKTLELSYEDIMVERSNEAMKESYINADYKCDTCVIGFSHNSSYNDHMNKHSSTNGSYSCPICKVVLSSVEAFTSHYKRHQRRYECMKCGKRSTDKKILIYHYDKTHDGVVKEYTCSICGKISNTLDSHRYHKDTHKARVQCPDCDKTFIHRIGLMNHKLAVHKYNNKFPCNVCKKEFRWKTSLKKHMQIHERKGSSAAAQCLPCGISFTSVCSLKRHLRSSLKHVSRDQLKFTCDMCNRHYSNKTKLRDHIESEHLGRKFKCDICSKWSKSRNCLERHMKNIHSQRVLDKMCHHCGKGFPTEVQLNSHIRSHTGERPFICEFCPTTFSQKSNLYKHNRQVHLNVKSKKSEAALNETLTKEITNQTTNVLIKQNIQNVQYLSGKSFNI